MSFSIIAAIASNNVIGKNNKLPWHIPEDLKHFYKLVCGKPVIMGHNTYQSIGKPITDSRNIVLSHNPALCLPGCEIVNSVDTALKLCENEDETMIVGGESTYRQFLPFVSKMYLTFIEHEFDGDAYFPKWQKNDWEVIDETTLQSNYSFRFVTLQKR
jgi:dihydrofolate reductase